MPARVQLGSTPSRYNIGGGTCMVMEMGYHEDHAWQIANLPWFGSAERLMGTMGISYLREQIAEKDLEKCRWMRRGHAADSFLK